MTIIGDPDYLEKCNFHLFRNYYFKKEDNFSGIVLYHNLSGNFVNGYKYEKGKVTSNVEPVTDTPIDVGLKSASGCYTIKTTSYYEQCTDWYTTSMGETSYSGTSCVYYSETTEYTVCDGGGEGGGGGSGTYAGTTVLGLDYDPGVICPRLEYLFPAGLIRPSNWLSKEVDRVNDLYIEMLNDCSSRIIDEYMFDMGYGLGGIELLNGSTYGEVAGLTESGDLHIHNLDELTSKHLAHEWFHLWQVNCDGADVFDPNTTGMAEWEAYLYIDIICYLEIGSEWDNPDNPMASTYDWAGTNSNSSPAEMNAYMDWLDSLTNGGTAFPQYIPQSEFVKYSEYFKKYGPAKSMNYSYDQNYRPNSYRRLVERIIDECK